MRTVVIVVKAVFDPEARVWLTESSDVQGLNLEAPTIEALVERLPGALADLLQDCDHIGDDGDGPPDSLPVEIIAHASTRVRLNTAA